MGKITVNDYTFNAANKTVTFDSFQAIELDKILLITNLTSNIIIFNFADVAKTGTVNTNVLTLQHDTTSMNSGDELQIFYRHDGYQTLIRENSGDPNTTYVGLAEPGSATASSVWQIKRLVISGNDLDVKLADGNYKFDNIFDNRESLTYS